MIKYVIENNVIELNRSEEKSGITLGESLSYLILKNNKKETKTDAHGK